MPLRIVARLELPIGEGKKWLSVKWKGVSGVIVLEITFSLVTVSAIQIVYTEKKSARV